MSQRERRPVTNRKRGYQFDSDQSDEEATQLVPPVNEKRWPSGISGGSRTKPSKRDEHSITHGAAVQDMLIVDKSMTTTQNEKGNKSSKFIGKSRTERQEDEVVVARTSGTQSRVKRTKRKINRKNETQDDDEGEGVCKLRRQRTLEGDSEDMESIFFAEKKSNGMEDKQEKLPQVAEDLDTVNIDEMNDNKQIGAEKKTEINDQTIEKNEKDSRAMKDTNETVDFLDMILGNDKVEKRRPPLSRRTANTSPYKQSDRRKEERRKLRRKDENEDIFKAMFSQKKSSQRDSSSQNSLSSDLDDIYNDPTNWKQNKRSPRIGLGTATTSDSINTIMDDNDKYEQLFKSGKLKKKRVGDNILVSSNKLSNGQ